MGLRILVLGFFVGCGAPTATGSGTSTTETTADPESSSTAPAGPTSSAEQTSDGGTDSSTGSTDGADGPMESSSSGEAATCDVPVLGPGEHLDLELEFGGTTRLFRLFVPQAAADQLALPLVLNFHGFTSNAGQQVAFSQMNEFAEDAGYVVAYPDGLDNSWNAGLCCGTSAQDDVDDVGFARELVKRVSTLLCIDPTRVYATGMSNGGYMSYRLACEASDVFAAIAPVAGVIGVNLDGCTPDRPVPVLHTHGTLDTLVPYEGGGTFSSPSVLASTEHFAVHNGCGTDPVISFEQDNVLCRTWTDCDEGADVQLCTVEGGGHCWFGNAFCPLGASTEVIHASQKALEFFSAHRL